MNGAGHRKVGGDDSGKVRRFDGARPGYELDFPPGAPYVRARGNSENLLVTVALETGFNLRASAIFAETASDFECAIRVSGLGSTADGKGILSLMSLGADTGSLLEITANGPGASNALAKLAGLTTHEGLAFFSVASRPSSAGKAH